MLRNFHSECPAPAPLVQSQALGNSGGPHNPGPGKNSDDARLVMFQSYYQCSDQVGEMFVYRDSHRGAVTREGMGPALGSGAVTLTFRRHCPACLAILATSVNKL